MNAKKKKFFFFGTLEFQRKNDRPFELFESQERFMIRDSTHSTTKGLPFGFFCDFSFRPPDLKMFLKALPAPIYTHFEEER